MGKYLILILSIWLVSCHSTIVNYANEDTLLKNAKTIFKRKMKQKYLIEPILTTSINYSLNYQIGHFSLEEVQFGIMNEIKNTGKLPPTRILKEKRGGIKWHKCYGTNKILYIPYYHDEVIFYFKSPIDDKYYWVDRGRKLYYCGDHFLFKQEMITDFNRIYYVPNVAYFGYKNEKLYKIDNEFWNDPKPLKYTLVYPKDSARGTDQYP